jgi:hypothetical protein
VWKYNVKQKKFFEAYKGKEADRAHILYLDKDKLPDLVVQKIRGTESVGINILLGSENGFIKIFDSYDLSCCDMHDGYHLSIGYCGDTEFEYAHISQGEDTMYSYRFNCNSRKLEKYAERKITK